MHVVAHATSPGSGWGPPGARGGGPLPCSAEFQAPKSCFCAKGAPHALGVAFACWGCRNWSRQSQYLNLFIKRAARPPSRIVIYPRRYHCADGDVGIKLMDSPASTLICLWPQRVLSSHTGPNDVFNLSVTVSRRARRARPWAHRVPPPEYSHR